MSCGVAAALALTASSLALFSARLPGRNGPSRSSAKHRRPARIAAVRSSTLSSAPLRSTRLSPRRTHVRLLSWGWRRSRARARVFARSPLHRPPPEGCLSRGHRARPLPDGKQASQPSAPGCHSRSPVPSSWFRTTSTACSARRLEGLLHPSADHGVRLVSCTTVRRPAHSPRRSPPLEELPRPAVGSPVTRDLGPLDVPPRSCSLPLRRAVSSVEGREETVEDATFEAFSVESVRNAGVRCRTATPCPSWASDSSSRSPPRRGRRRQLRTPCGRSRTGGAPTDPCVLGASSEDVDQRRAGAGLQTGEPGWTSMRFWTSKNVPKSVLFGRARSIRAPRIPLMRNPCQRSRGRRNARCARLARIAARPAAGRPLGKGPSRSAPGPADRAWILPDLPV